MKNKILKIGITSILLVSIVLSNVFMMPVKAKEVEIMNGELNKGLIAYLNMDENYEDLVNQYQPVFKGEGKVTYEEGVKGKAMRFSNEATQATRLEFVNRNDLQFEEDDAFSIGMWVKVAGIDNDPVDPTLLGTKDWSLGHNNGFALAIRDNYFNFNTKSIKKQTRYDNKFTTSFENRWQFVVLMQDKEGKSSIYVNGKKGSNVEETYVGSNNVASGVFSLGGTFKGNYGCKNQVAFDELKIWNRELSEDEIQYLYKNTATIKIAGPSEVDLSAGDVEAVFKLDSAGGIEGNIEWSCDNNEVKIKKVNNTTINIIFDSKLKEEIIILRAKRKNEVYEKTIKLVRNLDVVSARIIGDRVLVKDDHDVTYDFSLALYNDTNVPIAVSDEVIWEMDKQIKGVTISENKQNMQIKISDTTKLPCSFTLSATYGEFKESKELQIIEKGGLPEKIKAKAKYFLPFEKDLKDTNGNKIVQVGDTIHIDENGANSNGATFTDGSYLDFGKVDLSNSSIAFAIRSNSFTGVQDPCIIANKNWDPWQGSGFTFAYSMNSKDKFKNRLAYRESGGKDLFVSHTDKEWNNIVLSFDTDNDTYRLYVDGKLQDTVKTDNFVENWQNGCFDGSTLKLGNDGTGKYPANLNPNSKYSFTIDNFIITDGVLSDDEIILLNEINGTKNHFDVEMVGSDSIASESIYTVDLHVNSLCNANIKAIEFEVKYDPEIIELTNYINYKNGIKVNSDDYLDRIKVTYCTDEMPSGNIINYIKTRISKLQFQVKDFQENKDSTVKIQNLKVYNDNDFTDQNREIDLSQGKIDFKVYANKAYDYNEDGVIGVGDIALAPESLKTQIAQDTKIYPYKRVVSVTMDGGGISWSEDKAWYFQDMIGNSKGLENVRTNTYAMDLHNKEFATSYSAITVDPPISGHNYIAMLTGQNWPELPAEYQYVNSTANEYYWADFGKETPVYPTVFKAIKDQDPSRALAMFGEWKAIEEGLIEPDVGAISLSNDGGIVFDQATSYIMNNPDKFKKTAYTFLQSDVMDLHGHSYGYFIDSYYEKLKNYDDWWKELIDALKKNDLYDDTLIISNADHGGSVYQDEDGSFYGNHIVYEHPQDRTVYFSVGGQTVNKGAKLNGGRNTDLAGVVLESLRMDKPASMNQTGIFDQNMFLTQEELKKNNRNIEEIVFTKDDIGRKSAEIKLNNQLHDISTVDMIIDLSSCKINDIDANGKILRQKVDNDKLYLTIDLKNQNNVIATITFDKIISDDVKINEVMLGTAQGKEIYCDLTNTYGSIEVEPDRTDKIALKIALDLANAITDEDLANVVPVVVNEFKQARDQANEVYNDASASQDKVDAAFDRLSSIMQKLEFFKGDKTALKAFIDKVSDLEAAKYTEATWTPFNDALTAAISVYEDENAMQEEVNNAYNELVTAFLKLRLIPDKSLLEDLINQAEGLESANYTKATFDGLTKALNEAKVVFENPNATQVEVDNAKAELEKAMANLQTVKVSVSNGDTTSVKTGDESLVGMFAGIALLSIVGTKALRKKED